MPKAMEAQQKGKTTKHDPKQAPKGTKFDTVNLIQG